MSCVAVAVGVGAVGGALIAANATSNAANTEAGAANSASALQYQEFQQQQQNEQPYMQAGQTAIGQMAGMANQQPFSMADFQEDPGYQFNLQQGQNAIQASAAARGGLMNGNTLTSLSNYSQNAASNEYQNAYNRYNQNISNNFNRLASVAGAGQTATGQTNQAGQNYANQVGNYGTQAASAQGAAQIANGNTWGNTVSGIGQGVGNNWMTMNMMNQLSPSSTYTMPSLGSSSGYGSPMSSASSWSNPSTALTGGQSFSPDTGLANF
jgi:hypothetical protein